MPLTLLVKDGAGALQTVKTIDALAPTVPVDRSNEIVTGGLAQTLMSANSARRGFAVWNLHATTTLWVNEMGNAAPNQPSIPIGPGMAYETNTNMAPVGAVSIYSDTTGVRFSSREW